MPGGHLARRMVTTAGAGAKRRGGDFPAYRRGRGSDRLGERVLQDVQALFEQLVADRERGEEPEDVAERAAGEGDQALRMTCFVVPAVEGGVGRLVLRVADQLD